MNFDLDHEESACMLAALRSYCSELRMEIVDTDNAEYKRGLRHERQVLEQTLRKLDEAAVQAGESGDDDGLTALRFVAVWTT